jgi:hypothetical protein
MSFHMESMTPELYEQVYAAHDALLSKVCVPQRKWLPDLPRRYWAVDPTTGSCFMYVCRYAPADDVRQYLLLFRGRGLLIEMWCVANVMPFDLPVELESDRETIKQTIRDAYAVNGKYGVVNSTLPALELIFDRPISSRSDVF